MSLYSHYGSGTFGADDIIANESYSGMAGAYRMIEEAAENEHAIFESIIGQDFAEAYNAINPNLVTESQLEAIQEANGTGIWSKVVVFIRSIGEKILGILKNLKDKIKMVFVRDGEKLVKEYGSKVNENFNKGKLDKMKYKYAAPKTNLYDDKPFDDAVASSQFRGELNHKWDAANKTVNPSAKRGDNFKNYDPAAELPAEYKPYTTERKNELFEDALSKTIGGASTDSKSYNKDFDEFVFEDVEEKEGLDRALLNTVMDNLKAGKKALEAITKNETATKRTIKEMENNAKRIETETNKLFKEKTVKLTTSYKNAVAGQVISLCTIYSNASSRYYGVLGAAIKKDLKQCRAIFTKAATYNPRKSVNDQAELLQGVEESSDYEVDEMFENALFD